MSLSQRTDRFSGIGQILTIKPSSGTPMTLVNSYIVTSRGISPDAIHATNPTHKIQAAIAMEQRAKVMKKTGPARVYRTYINSIKKS